MEMNVLHIPESRNYQNLNIISIPESGNYQNLIPRSSQNLIPQGRSLPYYKVGGSSSYLNLPEEPSIFQRPQGSLYSMSQTPAICPGNTAPQIIGGKVVECMNSKCSKGYQCVFVGTRSGGKYICCSTTPMAASSATGGSLKGYPGQLSGARGIDSYTYGYVYSSKFYLHNNNTTVTMFVCLSGRSYNHTYIFLN